MAVKYKQVIQELYDEHKDVFEAFKKLHDVYAKDQEKHQKKYNKDGMVALELIRDAEQKLCHGMEKGMYASYSSQLATKFWQEIKKTYPLIDFVGVEIQ